MDINRFTHKAQEAVVAAQELARAVGQAEVRPLHLLRVLLDQSDGVVPQVLSRMGADLRAAGRRADGDAQPPAAVSGGAEPSTQPRAARRARGRPRRDRRRSATST